MAKTAGHLDIGRGDIRCYGNINQQQRRHKLRGLRVLNMHRFAGQFFATDMQRRVTLFAHIFYVRP